MSDDTETLEKSTRRMWPTPDAQNHRNGKKLRRVAYQHHGMSLHHAVENLDIYDATAASPQLTLFAEAFPANRTRPLADDWAPKTTAISGPNSGDSFASLDPDGSWRKTCQGYSQLTLDGSLEMFSETWPRAGMTRNGIAFLRSPLAPLIVETGSGLLPTPQRIERDDPSKIYRSSTNASYPDGRKCQPTLTGVVNRQMWPTPTREDSEQTGMRPATNTRPASHTLTSAARMWPTPAARDWKDGVKAYDRKKDGTATQDTLGRVLAASGETVGGTLNPTWVEWLMGFPLEWTDCEDSATPSSRKSRNGCSGRSKRRKTETQRAGNR